MQNVADILHQAQPPRADACADRQVTEHWAESESDEQRYSDYRGG